MVGPDAESAYARRAASAPDRARDQVLNDVRPGHEQLSPE